MNGRRFAGEMVAVSILAGLRAQGNVSQVQSQGALCRTLFCPLVAVTRTTLLLIGRLGNVGNEADGGS